MYLSPSLIKTFESCKLRYRWQYVDKIYKPQPITDETVFGRYLHRFMELYEHKRTIEIVKQLKEEFEIPDRIEDDLVKAISNTVKFLRQYENLEYENEKKIVVEIDNLKLSGKVDKIYMKKDDLIVIDFKTSKKFWKGMNDLQLKFYSLLLSKDKNTIPDHIETIVYYSFINAVDSNTYTSKDIEYFLEYLKDTGDRINTNTNWAPNKSKLCDYCQYKSDCPAWD